MDAIISLEVIEHMYVSAGHKMLKLFEIVAKNKIIISTPNGWMPQESFDGNDHQKHLSGWRAKDFINRGYKVYGINGLKVFRGKIQLGNTNTSDQSKYSLKSILMQHISCLLSKLYYHTPRWTSGILAVKTLR